MDQDDRFRGQSGGVNFGSGNVTVGGDIIGRDKVTFGEVSRAELDQVFHPLASAVAGHPRAVEKLEELKVEAGKGVKADDGVVAKLVDGLVTLVPGAVSAVVSAFGSPLLGGLAGPVTKFVLEKMQ